VDATQAGEHRYDARFPDWSEAGEANERQFIAETREMLGKIHVEALDAQNRVDAAILKNQLDYWEFSLGELKKPVVDPTAYTGLIGDGFDPLLTREFAPLDERMKNLRGRLQSV